MVQAALQRVKVSNIMSRAESSSQWLAKFFLVSLQAILINVLALYVDS